MSVSICGVIGALGSVFVIWDTRVFDTEAVNKRLFFLSLLCRNIEDRFRWIFIEFRGLMLMRVDVNCGMSWLV